MIVTGEETEVTELLWAVVTVDVDIREVLCEALVILGVDLAVVEVLFVEIAGGVVLDVVGFKVVVVLFFEETGTDDFAVGFKVVVVTFFEETGVVDGFMGKVEDSFVRLRGTCGVLPVRVALESSVSRDFFVP